MLLTSHRISSRMPRGCSGFSLAEMLVVVALIGLAVTMATPAFLRVLNEARLRSTAATVVAQMRSASTMALSTGQEHRVLFTPTTVSIQNATTGAYVIGHKNLRFEARTSVDSSAFAGIVRFLPDGTATAGNVVVTSDLRARNGALATSTVEILRSGLVRQLDAM